MRRRLISVRGAVAASVAWCWLIGPVAAEECSNGSFDSTFALIEKAIFEKHSCNNIVCHGEGAAGGLDLRPGVAYDNLVDVDATSVAGWKRVLAGQSAPSLLWVNLVAKTEPGQWRAPLRAMPLDPLPGLSTREIEALRLWIEKGAPRTGVVPDTADLLDACLPPPEPLQVKPLDPPPPGRGVQIVMPPWDLEPRSEDEVCFATYYDVTDQVPPALQQADGTFLWNFHQTRQDPLSHHMVPILYEGVASPDSEMWPNWRCVGGSQPGQSCNPVEVGVCGVGGICRTEISSSIGCLGYGPGDGGIGFTSPGISVTQQTAEEFQLPPGVYRSLPMKGIILWSSHAFNLTDKKGTLRSWMNFEFADPEEARFPAQQIFDADEIFKMNVAPYETQEICSFGVFPPRARIIELSSHMHKRGKRWRTFDGRFACAGGPHDGEACSPLGYDFTSPDLCAGAPCTSTRRVPSGDCDFDGQVLAHDVMASVRVALDGAEIDACRDADADGNWQVSVDEIVLGINAANHGVPPRVERNGHDSLLYTNLNYNDPVILKPEPPLVMAAESAPEEDRTLTFCGLFDNGHVNPNEVKLRSTSPRPPVGLGAGVGGPCDRPTHCSAGTVGALCSGAFPAQRHASCDSEGGPGGDGHCDACPLRGGVTTEDEMFILLGYYYVP